MNIKNALFLLLLVSTLLPSAPSLSVPDSAIYGHGNQSCGNWLEARKEGGLGELVYSTWLTGFVTGAGFAFYSFNAAMESAQIGTGEITMRDSDADGLDNWMDNYCKEHPLDSIANAAAALVNELVEHSKPDSSP